MGNEVMSAGQLLKQANQLKRAGRLDEALAEDGGGSYIALYHQVIELILTLLQLIIIWGMLLLKVFYTDNLKP
jgi:hypothetical protein